MTVLFFGEAPGRAFDDELVDDRNERPDDFQSFREIELMEGVQDNFGGLARGLADFAETVGLRNDAFAVLLDHAQRAASEVTEAVREIGVIALDQRIVTEAAILSEGNFAQQEIAQRE